MTTPTTPPLQPLLGDAVIALRAPTQVWSGREGDLGAAPIDGVYHGDVRHVRGLTLECAESAIEYISLAPDSASHVVFGGLLRGADDATPDPKVRLVRDRRVADGSLAETWTVASHLAEPTRVTLRLRLRPDFASMHEVKAGLAAPGGAPEISLGDGSGSSTAVARSGGHSFTLTAAGATVTTSADGEIVATWPLDVPARGRAEAAWSLALHDDAMVVRGAAGTWPGTAKALRGAAADGSASAGSTPAGSTPAGSTPAGSTLAGTARIAVSEGADPRLGRWLDTALDDLDALRLTLPGHPDDEFFAAGAPWFFTLFGRDALWAARLALPLDVRIAASTLRVLARLQGTDHDVDTAQEPGKILHELRATPLEIPGEGVVLPPLYYGSVDSTPLWICLLADAWRAGMPDDEVAALLPALRGALTWLIEHGDSDGDGFLDYIDRSGRGLANQGWKDSGDSIQWRDGALADGPIALCEVQGYAYEAALAGADLLEAFGPGASPSDAVSSDAGSTEAPSGETAAVLKPAGLRAWAADLRARFAASYWVQTPEGRYPAVALDKDKRPVDTLTSNIGHLLGTGILEPDEEQHVADLLLGPAMSTGFGIRTMSTGAAGYWPLSYHGGSVWTHDTAIAVHGMHRAGLAGHARRAVDGLLAAAEGFDYRVPELHGGDPATRAGVPTPYPAACRPQAWSAAAAITCLAVTSAPRADAVVG